MITPSNFLDLHIILLNEYIADSHSPTIGESILDLETWKGLFRESRMIAVRLHDARQGYHSALVSTGSK
jgi:hypothetical protein